MLRLGCLILQFPVDFGCCMGWRFTCLILLAGCLLLVLIAWLLCCCYCLLTFELRDWCGRRCCLLVVWMLVCLL